MPASLLIYFSYYSQASRRLCCFPGYIWKTHFSILSFLHTYVDISNLPQEVVPHEGKVELGHFTSIPYLCLLAQSHKLLSLEEISTSTHPKFSVLYGLKLSPWWLAFDIKKNLTNWLQNLFCNNIFFSKYSHATDSQIHFQMSEIKYWLCFFAFVLYES